MESVWSKSTEIKNHRKLNKNLDVDTIVIGAGITGILIANTLTEKGIDTAVIEANTVCSGQTKNTTAKITSQHGAIYDKIIKYYGLNAAKQYAGANEKAINDYEKLINKNNIDCDFEKTKAVLYSVKDKSIIEKEAFAAKKAGIDCTLTDKTDLPFPVAKALIFENQAQFNPLKFINELTENIKIYENTPAIKIENNTVYTKKHRIQAKHIVIACHYPFINFPGMYFLRMSQERSYVIAASCENYRLNGMYISADNSGPSLRNYKRLVLIGGGSHRTGNSKNLQAYKMLAHTGKKLFPSFLETDRWSAQDCITLDSIPYIGRFSKKSPNIYVATGFGKWGMTSSMVSANIISDMIMGKNNPYKEIFSPQRFSLAAVSKNLFTNFGETVKGFASHIKITLETADDVPVNTAGTIRYKGQNAGAYRDKDGRIYIVSLTCPHLKCTLNWNEATKTWDCPCHGSRYDYKGNLIDNPAQDKSILLNKKDIDGIL